MAQEASRLVTTDVYNVFAIVTLVQLTGHATHVLVAIESAHPGLQTAHEVVETVVHVGSQGSQIQQFAAVQATHVADVDVKSLITKPVEHEPAALAHSAAVEHETQLVTEQATQEEVI